MKSKIKRQISQSSTTLPLSFQERGRDEFVKNRGKLLITEQKNIKP